MKKTRAKVFLSCGQQKKLGELKLAEDIQIALKDYYDVFIAAQQCGNQPMLEEILREIKASDYFLFIDFKRSKRKTSDKVSLFSHQELAIAHYLQIPRLVFREEGLKPAQGMSGTWLDNAATFESREALPNEIKKAIENDPRWNPEHRNQLVIKDLPQKPDRIVDQEIPKWYRERHNLPESEQSKVGYFWHIPVHNGSYYRDAFNCIAYVHKTSGEKLKNIVSVEPDNRREDRRGQQYKYPRIQGLKWEGIVDIAPQFPKVTSLDVPFPKQITVPASKSITFERKLAAVMILEDEPRIAYLATVGDNGAYFTPFFECPDGEDSKTFDLTYTIVSNNFEPVEASYTLTIGHDVGDFKLEENDEK